MMMMIEEGEVEGESSEHFYNAYYVPYTFLSTLHTQSHLLLTIIWGRYYIITFYQWRK